MQREPRCWHQQHQIAARVFLEGAESACMWSTTRAHYSPMQYAPITATDQPSALWRNVRKSRVGLMSTRCGQHAHDVANEHTLRVTCA